MRDREPEARHDGVADELVQHAALLGDAVDHDGEIVVQQLDGTLGAERLGDRRKSAHVGEQDGRDLVGAAEQIFPAFHQLIGQARIHVTRHGGLHAFLGADVLDHDHHAKFLLVAAFKRCDRGVDREVFLAGAQRGVHQGLGFLIFLDPLDALHDPGVLADEELFRRFLQNVCCRDLQDTHTGGVAGDDLAVLVQGDDARRHTFQDAVVVVFHVLDVGEQLRVLKPDGDLCGERLEALFVFVRERPAAFVQDLRDAEDLAILVGDRHAEDRAGEITGLFVECRIEPQIRIGMRDVDGLVRCEHRTGNADVIRHANLRGVQAFADLQPQLARLLVV